ncbi:murein L,D-transpeptidase catalytic domain-containing protein [Flavobacterium foetidum]|uniref:murein L,D-transpeptidase catalytic domain-containing protein n=1 Tax=Flavobacterium foetidum TaxID=2026681 RepID=UPI001074F00D|nr:murein L,D-transpeptidase catalytic domain family protein [Flavobacterium foetidum]KAF2511900.1 peptidase [Flavobacterium foetidum]
MKVVTYLFVLMSFWSCKKTEERSSVLKNENISNTIATINKGENNDNYYNLFFKEAREYTEKKNYNQDVFFLIDLGKHSGLKRFFVYDFKKSKIVKSYIVSHGCGDSAWGGTATKENPKISNEPDSHCSSLGKYLISTRGVSQWGIKVNYLLLGKDKTNSNALNRAIVLHSWNAIPNEEVFPEGTPEGWGCPAVSNESMREIDELLKTNKKVLLWIIRS